MDFIPDIVAPSENNCYTLSVQNHDTQSIAQVNLVPQIIRDPDQLITINQITPQDVTIPEGETQVFQVCYDVACPPQGIVKIETIVFSNTVTSHNQGQFAIEQCETGPECHVYTVTQHIEESLGNCKTCANGEATQTECNDNNDCTIDTCHPYKGCIY